MRDHHFILALAVLLTGMGCERRAAHIGLPNVVIPVDCASEITLLHCDTTIDPPKCDSARVKYRSGCERIAVQR